MMAFADDGQNTPEEERQECYEEGVEAGNRQAEKLCKDLHVTVAALLDGASPPSDRPDYRSDVEAEHLDALRDLIAGKPLPEDPRFTALLLQVKSTIRQLQSLAERAK